MADKDSNHFKMLISKLDHFIAKAQEKSARFFKEVIAVKFDQEARAKIDKARHWLYQKTDEIKTEEDSHENKGLTVSMPITSYSRLNFFRCSPSDPEAMAADHHKFSLQGGTEQLLNTALVISEDTLPGSWNPLPKEIKRVKAAVCECLDKARIKKRLIHSSMTDEDNAQIDPETRDLVKKLDECITKFDQKRQILQNAIESEIEAVKKDERGTRELRLTLVHESGDTSSNLEAESRKIANVKQWLNQKAPISGVTDTTGDQDQGNSYSLLIVDDDLADRDTIRRYTMSVGTERQLTMEFQEAKNAKEAVNLHLVGASFDLIIMDEQNPIMTGIQATQLLRKMGVKSQIVGVTSESDRQAFFDVGALKSHWILHRSPHSFLIPTSKEGLVHRKLECIWVSLVCARFFPFVP